MMGLVPFRQPSTLFCCCHLVLHIFCCIVENKPSLFSRGSTNGLQCQGPDGGSNLKLKILQRLIMPGRVPETRREDGQRVKWLEDIKE